MANNPAKNYIDILLNTIATIVNEDKRPYKEKVQAILAACDEADRINLSEFVSWFDEVEW